MTALDYGTMTREQYRRERGNGQEPEAEVEERRCACGVSLAGRNANVRWCSNACRMRQGRTPRRRRRSQSSETAPATDPVAALLAAVSSTAPIVAVSLEFANGVCVSIGPAGK